MARWVWGVWVCLVLAACGGGVPALGPPPCDLAAGEVLWTGLQVAPPRSETGAAGREWLRLENRSERRVRLRRAVVTVQGAGSPRRWVLEAEALDPGEVLELDSRHLPGLSLANDGGEVSLLCAGTVVHRVRWGGEGPPMGDGQVWVRDGAAPPLAEDAPEWWCPQAQVRSGVCGRAFCLGAAGPRPVRPLSSARLTEVLADPAGADAGREWVEVHAQGGDLNALTLVFEAPSGQRRSWRLQSADCVAAQGYLRLWLGGTGVGLRLSGPVLPNGGGRLRLWADGREQDAVDLPPARVDRAWSLDETAGVWCEGRAAPGAALAGSPGAPNPPCGEVCWQGSSWRLRRDPEPGAVALVEVMADPAGADAGREWVEVVNTGLASVDLGGLSLTAVHAESGRRRGPWALAEAECLPLAAGARQVLAGEAAVLPPATPRHVVSALSLYNAPQILRLEGAEVVVDEAVLPAPSTGRALGVRARAPAVANDDPGAWCGQRRLLEDGSRATPGEANDACDDRCLEDGAWRPVRPAEAETLVFTAVAEGAAGPWLELRQTGPVAVDLNGSWLSQENGRGGRRSGRLEARACLSLAPGATLRLPPPLDPYLGDTVWTLRAGAEVVASAHIPVRRDRVVRLAAPAEDAAADDDVARWCVADESACPP